MATKFSFEPRLIAQLSSEQKELVLKFGTVKEKGVVEIYPQYRYNVVTARYNYLVTFERKVVSKKKALTILERNKGNQPIKSKVDARIDRKLKGEKPDPNSPDLIVWKEVRQVPKIEFIEVKEQREVAPQIGSKEKVGRFWYHVKDVEIKTIKSTYETREEVSIEPLHPGSLIGDRVIISVKELVSPLNQVISRLCALQNGGSACISGQLHKTVKALHASKEPNNPQILAQAMFTAAKFPYMRNKLAEIEKLYPGDYSEKVYFDKNGKYEGRDLTIVAGSHHKGWQEAESFRVVKLKPEKHVSKKPVEYRENSHWVQSLSF